MVAPDDAISIDPDELSTLGHGACTLPLIARLARPTRGQQWLACPLTGCQAAIPGDAFRSRARSVVGGRRRAACTLSVIGGTVPDWWPITGQSLDVRRKVSEAFP